MVDASRAGPRAPGRAWRWRRNPLRRRSDVVDAWIGLLLAFLLFVGAPLAGALTGWAVHTQEAAQADRLRATSHSVQAVVTDRLPRADADSQQVGGGVLLPATVRWTTADGTRSGVAKVPAGTEQGGSVQIRVDDRGNVVPPVRSDVVIAADAIETGSVVTAATFLVVGGARLTANALSTHHHLVEWERDWVKTAPDWSAHGR
ncbi:hypothetical protein ACH41E_17375 [Streptomyces sp. NPDC020412]|uniref:Rv1733c family protein n=1 Tax=Streptomyces sp. NPDC020412 TaxID=3365073 RepID=UPI0037A96540